jgi:uncharacterized protein with PIN domain
MLNFKPFWDNTSTRETLFDFIEGRITTFQAFEDSCWPPECKEQVRKMKALGHKKAKERIKRALRREGYGEEIDTHCPQCGKKY